MGAWQRWRLQGSRCVSCADTHGCPPPDATANLAWHKQVPHKVSIVAWRLLQDRLPTKINLQRRGIAQVTDTRCVSGCGKEETTSHLFLHCHVFGAIWQHIRSWIGVSGADTDNVPDHIQQFIHYSGYTKARRSFLQLLWLLCVWLVWNERNSRLFNNTETSIDQLLDKAKYHSLWWLKANNITFVHGTQTWWSNPFYCLGIDWPFCIYTLWYIVVTVFCRVDASSTPCAEDRPTPLLIYIPFWFLKKKNKTYQ